MFWDKDKPSRTGWYWWRRTKNHGETRWIVYFVEVEDGESIYWQDGTAMNEPERGWWAGPMAQPISDRGA